MEVSLSPVLIKHAQKAPVTVPQEQPANCTCPISLFLVPPQYFRVFHAAYAAGFDDKRHPTNVIQNAFNFVTYLYLFISISNFVLSACQGL